MTAAISLERPLMNVPVCIDDAVAHARHLGRTALFSRVDRLPFAPDPVAFLAASSAALGTGTLWEQPAAGLAFAGAGSTREICATGPGRFGQVSAAMRDLESVLVRTDDVIFPCLGGFAFREHSNESLVWRGFPSARLVVPQVLIQNDGHDALLRVTVEVDPRSSPGEVEQQINDLWHCARGWARVPLAIDASQATFRIESFPSRTAWESSGATAVAMNRQGALDKVDLARE